MPVFFCVCFRTPPLSRLRVYDLNTRYRRHGLEDEDFIAAFEGVRTMQRGYDGLAKALGGGGGGGAGGRGSQHM